MIELRNDQLVFTFPRVHDDAGFSIDFQRTLRIPDDGHDYPLPAGLGRFPLRHVDDFAHRVPPPWITHGGVMMPVYQSEALWLNFTDRGYPIALKVAAGKVNAVTGGDWDTDLHHGSSPSKRSRAAVGGPEQDYMVLPQQPWLDGFNVGKGSIRQFVAMPLGQGYTAEEQLNGRAEHGGLQILAYPMSAAAYEKWREKRRPRRQFEGMAFAAASYVADPAGGAPDMGLGLGGRMRQDIMADPHKPRVWDLANPARCFVHLTNSRQWAAITGGAPPTQPPTPQEYRDAGIPWFDYYATGEAVAGSAVLAGLDSVATFGKGRRQPLPDNDPVPIDRVIDLGPARPRQQVRELP